MGYSTSDISVTSETADVKSLVLTDKEYLAYRQQEELIKALKELAQAIKRGSK